jgi:group I intron endonuclease
MINSHFYIGATQRSLRVRMAKHVENAKRGIKGLFYNAIRGYGVDNFKFISLHECTDFFDALDKERQLISSLHPQYNMTDGGGGSKGYKHTKEALEKMKQSHLGKKITDPIRLGKMRRNLSKQRSAWFRKVRCINDGKVFDNACAAARYYGISDASVRMHCNGRVKNTKYGGAHGLAFEDVGRGSHV